MWRLDVDEQNGFIRNHDFRVVIFRVLGSRLSQGPQINGRDASDARADPDWDVICSNHRVQENTEEV